MPHRHSFVRLRLLSCFRHECVSCETAGYVVCLCVHRSCIYHRIVELDDILVQAFTLRARLRMIHLMRAAEDQYTAQRRVSPLPFAKSAGAITTTAATGTTGGTSAGATSNKGTSGGHTSPIEIAAAMLTEMFKSAFQQCKTSGTKSSTPRQLFT
jgi:hypothetical protein